MQYCFFIASDFTFTTRQIHIWALFPLWPATSSFLELIVLCSSLVACWTLSDMDGELLTFLCHIYLPFHTAHEALGKNTRVHCHFLLQWTIFCQNSSLWPIHLGWPWPVWLIALLNYASLFATTRLCFRTMVLEKTLERPLDCKIKSVNPKGNQYWIFIGRTDSEAEAPKLWPPDIKCQLVGKDSLLLGKIEGKRRRGWHTTKWLGNITNSMGLNFSKLGEIVKDRESWCVAVHGATKSWTQISNWTTTMF